MTDNASILVLAEMQLASAFADQQPREGVATSLVLECPGTKRDWVRVKLVWEHDQAPVPDEPVTITHSSGDVLRTRTDANGTVAATFQHLSEASASVCFRRLDREVWCPQPAPVVRSTGLAMVFREGDCIAKIADAAGVLPEQIWEHPDNVALHAVCGSLYTPMDAGHQVFVPHVLTDEVTVPLNLETIFVRRAGHELLRIHFAELERNNQVNHLEGTKYLLELDDDVITGKLSDSGRLEQMIPARVQHAALTLWHRQIEYRYELDISHVLSFNDQRGGLQRLRMLGFRCDPDLDAIADTTSAVAAFQKTRHLEETGQLDDATLRNIDDMFKS